VIEAEEERDEMNEMTHGQTISYEDAENFSAPEWDDIKSELASRDLCLLDEGDGYEIVWLYAQDGSELNHDEDDVRAGAQPATSQARADAAEELI
jgi:hypothetical protein